LRFQQQFTNRRPGLGSKIQEPVRPNGRHSSPNYWHTMFTESSKP